MRGCPLLGAGEIFHFLFFLTGVLEIFGSWSKLAPHFEGAPFEGELEKQLQDAMGEQDSSSNSVTVVTTKGDSNVKTGFSPP